MRNRKRVLSFALLALSLVCLGSCAICGLVNRPVLGDPPQDSLDMVWHTHVNEEVAPTDLQTQYMLAREVVDTWSSDAYFYFLSVKVPCSDSSTPSRVTFHFSKLDYLHFYYPKQWTADVKMDFETGEGKLQVEKEQDRPPKIQRHLNLDRLAVGLQEILEMTRRELQNIDCISVYVTLNEDTWDISYSASPGGLLYNVLTIDALTGKVERKAER